MSSLQERVAARRRAREKTHPFVLAVPGYEDIGLYARYAPLGFEDLYDLMERHEDDEPGADAVLALRADTLARSCVEVLEKTGDGENDFRSIGCRGWNANEVREHVIPDLPEKATARDALFAIFNGPTGGNELTAHFLKWDAEASKSHADEAQETAGESQPSSAEGI